MRLVIVESPYAGDVEANLTYARAAMHNCFMRGEAPFASHLLYTQPGILRDDIDIERASGIKAGLEWAKKASCSVFYTDRGWSRGMLAALHGFNLKQNYPFKLRSLGGRDMVQVPATLDEDIERLLRHYIED